MTKLKSVAQVHAIQRRIFEQQNIKMMTKKRYSGSRRTANSKTSNKAVVVAAEISRSLQAFDHRESQREKAAAHK